MSNDVTWVVNGLKVPWSLISAELEGLYGTRLLTEFKEIIGYYNVYERGAEFISESAKTDFTGANLRFKECRKLINKEARLKRLGSCSPNIRTSGFGFCMTRSLRTRLQRLRQRFGLRG